MKKMATLLHMQPTWNKICHELAKPAVKALSGMDGAARGPRAFTPCNARNRKA